MTNSSIVANILRVSQMEQELAGLEDGALAGDYDDCPFDYAAERACELNNEIKAEKASIYKSRYGRPMPTNIEEYGAEVEYVEAEWREVIAKIRNTPSADADALYARRSDLQDQAIELEEYEERFM